MQQECTAKRSCVYTWDCFPYIFVARFPKTVISGVWQAASRFVYDMPCLAAVGQQNTTNNMKTIQKKWLPLFLLAAVTFLFPACEGNINDPDDVAGAITINLRHGSNIYIEDNQYYNYWGVSLGGDNNFYVWWSSMVYSSHGDDYCYIVDMGKKNLNQINQISQIPQTGWGKKTAVTPKHSYVAIFNYYEGSEHILYLKLYVKEWITDTSGSIIGAVIQYCEWNPEQ